MRSRHFVRKGTLCRLLGLRPSNLTYWVDEGLLQAAVRDGYTEPQAIVLAVLVALTDSIPLQTVRACWSIIRAELASRILAGDWYLVVESEGSAGLLVFEAAAVVPACAHGRPVRVLRLQPYLEKVHRAFEAGAAPNTLRRGGRKVSRTRGTEA